MAELNTVEAVATLAEQYRQIVEDGKQRDQLLDRGADIIQTDRLDVLVPFFKAGIEANEFCLWITSDPLSSMEARQSIGEAQAEAFALSLSVAYPTNETMVSLLQVAHREAYSLSIAAAIPTKETIEDLIRKAHAQMSSLSSRLPTIEEKPAQAEQKTEKG